MAGLPFRATVIMGGRRYGHSEYYPRQRINPEGDTPLVVSVPEDANLGQKRSGRIYEVDGATDGKLVGHSRDGAAIPVADLVEPPCSGCEVSDEVALPFSP
ncbi:hypothetical protein Acsp01_68700 [Actinoplanes sp. NBRC 101535]|nr:hypothetical protein Acsp01_68700 [Actinoplanes sp. NBRC 101535]